MRVSDAIRYLSEYEDQEREIMISWNDREHLEEGDPRVWEEAVIYFEKWGGAEFNAECREAISIARKRIEEEGELCDHCGGGRVATHTIEGNLPNICCKCYECGEGER